MDTPAALLLCLALALVGCGNSWPCHESSRLLTPGDDLHCHPEAHSRIEVTDRGLVARCVCAPEPRK